MPNDEKSTAELVADLTLEEKASLSSGASFWSTTPIERFGVPGVVMADGPHGLRRQPDGGDHLALGASLPATCFPPAVALGATWDPELIERVGAAVAVEAVAQGVHVVLGPGVNLKRSPLGGRNFEYFSEDPVVSGLLGAAFVRGLQGRGVGASVKHFAANNQEHDRMRVSADIDERPLRELYLRAFQIVVEDSRPWTVMCSYNRINGVPACENRWLLTTVLRGEWGFGGLVVSDWGAVADRVAALRAGLDLEMPASAGRTDALLVAAVRAGELEESLVDRSAARVVDLARAAVGRPAASADHAAHHALAREAAVRGIVLLKNDGDLLPIARGSRIGVIGEFARTPRFQGGGSSQVAPTRIDTALDALRSLVGDESVDFAPGWVGDAPEASGPAPSARALAEAVAVARAAETAVVFLGLEPGSESEGFDRDSIELPPEQLALLDAVLAANPNTVVVLSHGGVLRLSGFASRVPAILDGALLGQAGGTAIADVLLGEANPSGRLAETVPVRIEDTPAHLDFPGEHGRVRYGEGLFVGYRWYDARAMDVSFPFGHGLSYTTFDYADATAESTPDGLVVRLTVANAGPRAGREVVQAYVSVPGSAVVRPPRELKGFATVHLEPGESSEVVIPIGRRELAYWHTRARRWVVEGGEYLVQVGASSRDIRCSAPVAVEGDPVVLPFTLESTVGELLADPVAKGLAESAIAATFGDAESADPLMLRMMHSLPIDRLGSFAGPGFDLDGLGRVLDALNAARGLPG